MRILLVAALCAWEHNALDLSRARIHVPLPSPFIVPRRESLLSRPLFPLPPPPLFSFRSLLSSRKVPWRNRKFNIITVLFVKFLLPPPLFFSFPPSRIFSFELDQFPLRTIQESVEDNHRGKRIVRRGVVRRRGEAKSLIE